ncbi:MAG: hypothetical protein LBR67_09855 [Dysgonamonadaceae bacterium]|jgi:MFS family permease|nr:hypothetical protein [Dysgonamonadaceae bacterium]
MTTKPKAKAQEQEKEATVRTIDDAKLKVHLEEYKEMRTQIYNLGNQRQQLLNYSMAVIAAGGTVLSFDKEIISPQMVCLLLPIPLLILIGFVISLKGTIIGAAEYANKYLRPKIEKILNGSADVEEPTTLSDIKKDNTCLNVEWYWYYKLRGKKMHFLTSLLFSIVFVLFPSIFNWLFYHNYFDNESTEMWQYMVFMINCLLIVIMFVSSFYCELKYREICKHSL